VAAAAQELLNKSDNERSGVLSTAMSFLGLYRDPVVAKVTSASHWRIADLMAGQHPTSLYLVIPPGDISRTKPLIRLILNQIGRRLTEDLNPGNRPQRLLLMLDEFPALGRLDFFESALAFMAGYGIKAFLIAQSLNQIEKAYGQNNAILDNCHVRVSFATNDERTAKRISDALGTATEMRAMKNYAGHRLSPWLGHLMVSRSETARALLTPGEVMQLPPDDEIVMAAGIPPIRARKARYFLDPRFTARVLEPPRPVPTTVVKPAADDWSGLKPIQAEELLQSSKGTGDPAATKAVTPTKPKASVKKRSTKSKPNSNAENSGIRQEPGLPEHEDIAPEPDRPFNPFDPDADTSQDDTAQNRQTIDRAMRRNARNASLDPGDGIEL
jgi:type IV secretion system protein VirD4